MDVNQITLSAAGGALLVAAVQGVRAWFARNIARDKTETTVDERAADLIKTAVEPFKSLITQQGTIIDEERTARVAAEAARDAAVLGQVSFMERTYKEHREEQKEQEAKHTDSLKRVHARVDECERERVQERTTIAMLISRVEAVENRERDTLLKTPAPGQAPIIVQTPAPTTIGTVTT